MWGGREEAGYQRGGVMVSWVVQGGIDSSGSRKLNGLVSAEAIESIFM